MQKLRRLLKWFIKCPSQDFRRLELFLFVWRKYIIYLFVNLYYYLVACYRPVDMNWILTKLLAISLCLYGVPWQLGSRLSFHCRVFYVFRYMIIRWIELNFFYSYIGKLESKSSFSYNLMWLWIKSHGRFLLKYMK